MRAVTAGIAALARQHGLQMKWLDQASLRRAGADAFLAVAAGNAGAVAGIARLQYRPARRAPAVPTSRWSARASSSTPAE